MEENFIRMAKLIGDPARAAMLWNLLDGRAYTAGELALCADLSASAASNHLNKLVTEGLLTMERQGRHKYFAFASPQIAAVIEAMGTLAPWHSVRDPARTARQQGLWYCRKCYDHLAGQVGVQLTEAMVQKDFLRRQESSFSVTESGEAWLAGLDIRSSTLMNGRRPLARPCLDWSERKVHLAGSLGQALLEKYLAYDWIRVTQGSRAVIVTGKGRQLFGEQLQISL